MNVDESDPKPFSLRRWSQRKLAAARAQRSGRAADGNPVAGSACSANANPVPGPQTAAGERCVEPAAAGTCASAVDRSRTGDPPANGGANDVASSPPKTAAALAPTKATATPAAGTVPPAIESLTIDSDFTAFLRPDADETLKRAALKQLFRDPHFNVMDGLDVYIDDYTKPDPIAPDIVKQMVQGRYIFDPPKTRVTEAGYVEDVPPDAAPVDVPETQAANDDNGEAPDIAGNVARIERGPSAEAPPAASGQTEEAKSMAEQVPRDKRAAPSQ